MRDSLTVSRRAFLAVAGSVVCSGLVEAKTKDKHKQKKRDKHPMTQYARPNSTISNDGFTPVGADTLWETIDETTPDDNDYNRSSFIDPGGSFEVGLSALVDPETNKLHYVKYRISCQPSTYWAKVQLKQGTTEIAYWTHDPPPTGPTNYQQLLTDEEANSITDYGDLRLRFSFSGSIVLAAHLVVYWAEMELPTSSTIEVPTLYIEI